MESINYICGIFYAEEKGQESSYGNLKGRSSESKFQNVYWKNLIVFFASIYRSNPSSKLILFTNVDPPNKEWIKILSDCGVTIQKIKYDHRPTKGKWNYWQSTFFIIDAINYLRKIIKSNDTVLFLDIDCVVIRPLDNLIQTLTVDKFIKYDVGYKENDSIHNLSRLGMKTMIEDYHETELDYVPLYFGGEIYGFFGKENVDRIYEELDIAWKVYKSESSNFIFNTEEHLFNYVFWKICGNSNGNANEFIKRIWTTASYRNVQENDLDLSIWHVPSEKTKGMFKLFTDVSNQKSRFWSLKDTEWISYLGKTLTIPKRDTRRFISDELKNKVNRLKKILN